MSIEQRLAKIQAAYAGNLSAQRLQEIREWIEKIEVLKKQKNAVLLGHNYMTPEVFFGVSDIKGDSLELARKSAQTKADIILFNGVHFMAETAKILNPSAKVLIADSTAGCSLAESITPEDVRDLRQKHPGVPIVSYINCTAVVKAEVDVICTSANASQIVEALPGNEVVMVPDGYLAGNVAKTSKKIIHAWPGKCMVHELFTLRDVEEARLRFPHVKIIAHPECMSNVTDKVDFTGSTSRMSSYIEQTHPDQVLLFTECSMGDNLRAEFPEVEFVPSCQSCPYMKKITLEKIYDALLYEKEEVTVPEQVREGALRSLQAMFDLSKH